MCESDSARLNELLSNLNFTDDETHRTFYTNAAEELALGCQKAQESINTLSKIIDEVPNTAPDGIDLFAIIGASAAVEAANFFHLYTQTAEEPHL